MNKKITVYLNKLCKSLAWNYKILYAGFTYNKILQESRCVCEIPHIYSHVSDMETAYCFKQPPPSPLTSSLRSIEDSVLFLDYTLTESLKVLEWNARGTEGDRKGGGNILRDAPFSPPEKPVSSLQPTEVHCCETQDASVHVTIGQSVGMHVQTFLQYVFKKNYIYGYFRR